MAKLTSRSAVVGDGGSRRRWQGRLATSGISMRGTATIQARDEFAQLSTAQTQGPISRQQNIRILRFRCFNCEVTDDLQAGGLLPNNHIDASGAGAGAISPEGQLTSAMSACQLAARNAHALAEQARAGAARGEPVEWRRAVLRKLSGEARDLLAGLREARRALNRP